MVAHLFWRKFVHRREKIKRVACKHDDIARLPVDRAQYMRIQNELDWVSTARVLNDAHVVIIRCMSGRFVDNVLKDAAKGDAVVISGSFAAERLMVIA
jgi:hypothetical protein